MTDENRESQLLHAALESKPAPAIDAVIEEYPGPGASLEDDRQERSRIIRDRPGIFVCSCEQPRRRCARPGNGAAARRRQVRGPDRAVAQALRVRPWSARSGRPRQLVELVAMARLVTSKAEPAPHNSQSPVSLNFASSSSGVMSPPTIADSRMTREFYNQED